MSLKCWCKVKEEKGRKRRYIGIIYLDQKSFFDVEEKNHVVIVKQNTKGIICMRIKGSLCVLYLSFLSTSSYLLQVFLFSSFIFRLIFVIVYLTFPSPIEAFKTEVSSLLAAFHFF